MEKSGEAGSKNSVLTQEQRAECARLRVIWERKKRPLALTEEELSLRMGLSQTAVLQFLNEHAAPDDLELFQFSVHLAFNPTEVRPTIFSRGSALTLFDTTLNQKQLQTLKVGRRYLALSSESKSVFDKLLSELV